MSDANQTIAVRKKIAKDFCRNILWIDDQICPSDATNGGDKYRDFFVPITACLQEQGHLVNMLSFQPDNDTRSGDDPLESLYSKSLETSKKLSSKAEVILLDWQLVDENHEHSIEIIKSATNSLSTCFIIIVTQKDQDFVDNILHQDLLDIGVNPFKSITSNEGLDIYTATEQGTHITHIKKSELEDMEPAAAAAKIIDNVFQLICTIYPDYLHWTAIEIAAQIRNHYPAWLHTLPHGTDMAVLQELLDSETEIRNSLPENLLEDLITIAKLKNLESLSIENVDRANWPNQSSYAGISSEDKVAIIDKIIHLLPTEFPLYESLKLIKEESSVKGEAVDKASQQLDNLGEIIRLAEDSDQAEQNIAAQSWLESHQSFCEYTEVLPITGMSKNPSQGSIYKSGTGDYYLCASQDCDCARGDKLIFIKATPIRSTEAASIKQESTTIRFEMKDYRFDGRTEQLNQVKARTGHDGIRKVTRARFKGEPGDPEHYTKVGQLRPAIASRIITRYWSSLTRPAVNHPTVVRSLREKE